MEGDKRVRFNDEAETKTDAMEDPQIGAAPSGGGRQVDPDIWRKAFEHRQQLHESSARGAERVEPRPDDRNPAPINPDAMYPPRREGPNTHGPEPYKPDDWKTIYGSNLPPVENVEPLAPIGSVFFFRVMEVDQPVYQEPDPESKQIGLHTLGEVVKVVDFRGAWAKLGVDTEEQDEDGWEGWMLSEGPKGTLLEEIEDINEYEEQYTKQLFKKVWKLHDHVMARLRERGPRADQYFSCGRIPPGRRAQLPQGTRCINAFWGLEARWIALGPGEEYWPQGALTLTPQYLRAGWQQPPPEIRAGHWRVFAARPFGANELVEVCPLMKVDQLEHMFASFMLRMNIVETPADEDAHITGFIGKLHNNLPLGFGMMYQQSIDLWDVKVNWEPVQNYNCKMIPADGHMYIYTTRKVQVDEELVLYYNRAYRTEMGEAIDFTGFTPYWRREKMPEHFAKALVTPHGPRKVKPVPGHVKYGKSSLCTDRLHSRGAFADRDYKRGEIIEMAPALTLDDNGAHVMADYCFELPAVEVQVGDRKITKRERKFVLPLGNGGMYNHQPRGKGENVQWYYDETTMCVIYVAAPTDSDTIKRNTELCFDYGEAWWDNDRRRRQRPGADKLIKKDLLKPVMEKRHVLDAHGNFRPARE